MEYSLKIYIMYFLIMLLYFCLLDQNSRFFDYQQVSSVCLPVIRVLQVVLLGSLFLFGFGVPLS